MCEKFTSQSIVISRIHNFMGNLEEIGSLAGRFRTEISKVSTQTHNFHVETLFLNFEALDWVLLSIMPSTSTSLTPIHPMWTHPGKAVAHPKCIPYSLVVCQSTPAFYTSWPITLIVLIHRPAWWVLFVRLLDL